MNKYSIKDFERDFSTNEACLEWLKSNRWPDGIHCSKCQRITKHYKVTGRSAYACEFCGTHVYPMAGTILEHSATELRKWFHAMFLMATTRCGISAKQLEREIGVTYKTAWMIDKGMPYEKQISISKAWCNEAYRRIIALGHQVFGGIGYCEEHDLTLYFRRARMAEVAFGDTDFHRKIVANHLYSLEAK